MSNYEPKYKQVAGGNPVELKQFGRAGDFTEIAEVARVADEKGDIDTVNQKIRLPESYVESKIGTGLSDMLGVAATVVESFGAATTFGYVDKKSDVAERQTGRLDAKANNNDFKEVRQMLSSSESKRKAAHAGAVGGVGTAAAGWQLGSLPVAAIGGAMGYGSAALAAVESNKGDAYAQEAGKGWHDYAGTYKVELV